MLAPMAAGASKHHKLGFAMGVALVVGNMVGSGAFLLPASLAPLGWNSVLGWLATIAGALCLAVALARIARGFSGGCAPFAYTAAAFGPGAGFVVAWAYWISIWVTNAALALAVVSNLSILAPALAEPAASTGIAIAMIWAMTLINCRGVRTAGGVQLLTTLLKLLPLLAAILVGAWVLAEGRAALPPLDAPPPSFAALSTAATFTLFAMLGFESAMVADGRVEGAEHTVPRATLVGTALTGLIYLFACSAVTLLLPAAAVAASNAPFATFFTALVGPGTGALVALFAAIAALGALNGFVLLQGEPPLALARERLLPGWFCAENRFEAPWRIHLISSGLASALVLVNASRGLAGLFQFMVLVTTSATIVFYLAGAAAALKLAREGRVAWSAGYATIAVAGLLYSLWALYGAGVEASAWSLAMTAAGLPVYLVMRRVARSSPPAANPAASPESAA